MSPALQPCGTLAAYQRHLHHGEAPCDACRKANRDYHRRRAEEARENHAAAVRELRELRELRAELADMRALLSEVLSGFSATGVPGMGYTARADDADFERWLKLGGIEAL